jgi:hypothetical protein
MMFWYNNNHGLGRRRSGRLFVRRPLRQLPFGGLPFRCLPLGLRRGKGLPGLLGFVPSLYQLITQLRDLLLQLNHAGCRLSVRQRLVHRGFRRRKVDEAVPLLPRQAQIGIRLAEYRQAEQKHPGSRGRC